MDANALAHELHRRRLSLSSNAPRHQAAGEARFCDQYGFMPTLDDFDHYMNMTIWPEEETQWSSVPLMVITSDKDEYEIDNHQLIVGANFVFTSGEKLAETEVVGWLPYDRLRGAPVLHGRKQLALKVHRNCLFPMPEALDPKNPVFVEPDLRNIPMLWDQDLQAFWTPIGLNVYDSDKKDLVLQSEQEARK